MRSKEWIRLADGTVVDHAYVVNMLDNKIAVYATWESDFTELYGTFGNPKKTVHMHSDQYGDVREWDGYTNPVSMTINDGTAVVVLVKE